MANTITYETLFESVLQDRLDHPLNWKEMCDVTITDTKIISSSYEDTIPAAQTVTRGSGFTIQAMGETAETLNISTGRDVPVFVDFADLAQSPWTKPAEIFNRIGSILNEYIESAVLAQHASWRNLGGSGGAWTDNTDVTLAVSASNVDDLIRLCRTVIRSQNGQVLLAEKGLGMVWAPANFEFVEAFAQANGFTSADEALKNGLAPQVKYLGATHYVSNDNATNHMFAGIRGGQRLGILRGTYGKAMTADFPVSTTNLSGKLFYSRVDVGHLTPTTLANVLFDIRVA